MAFYTIGVDFGSLSGRAVLVDTENGREVADAVLEYPHAVMDTTLCDTGIRLPADFALQHPRDYIEVLETVIPEVLKKSGVRKEEVIGICIDFTTCTMLPVRKDLTPLCFDGEYSRNPHAYVKMWKHHAAQPYADKLNEMAEKRGEAWLPRFGGKVSSEWLFPKIWETLDLAPEVYAAADAFIEAGDFVTACLTGEITRSYAFAAYKGEYVEENGGWPSEDFLASLDERLRTVVSDKLYGRIVYGGERVGVVSEEAAKRFGLAPGTAVAAALPDAHISSAAMKQREAGDMFGIFGTSACYMVIDGKDVIVPGTCGTVKDGLTPGFYGYEAGLCCLGDHYAWACENAVSAEYVREAEERGIPMIRLLCEKAEKQMPGEHGLLALNWWNGNRNILVDAELSGMLIGMSLRTKPEDILRALIEATAFGTRVIIENYEQNGVNVKRFVAGGGIARKDPFTMQLFADVLKLDVEVAKSKQIPALSGAIYAAVAAGSATGGYDTYAEACERMGSPIYTVYRPNPEASRVYDRMYAEYVKLHDYFGRGGSNVMKTLRAIREGK
ncbi:MAG: ribulokinase [Clostridia bacterium]|nr:ribulokinase [Clostridia bacterium]